MRSFIIIFFLLSFSTLLLKAQPGNAPKGRISGKVIDAVTKQPVDYATISVFLGDSPSPINGMVTDPKGNFVISNLNPGEYRVGVDFIGYQKKTIDHLTISATALNIGLGTISITPSQNQLQGVQIVSKAPVVQNKIDKMVYNVFAKEKDPLLK